MSKFSLGSLYITPGAQSQLSESDVASSLRRHIQGDWGEVCKDDASQNDWARDNEARILSVYHSQKGLRFWVITEADRSSTTVLLPDEY